MSISCRCEECGNVFVPREDEESCIEIDFKMKQIRHICRNKSCKHENILDLEMWQKVSQRSPLPRPIIGSM